MNKIKIIAICGKSASGKDTLMKEMLKCDKTLHEIVSCTTRPPREGEVHGKNYFFLTNQQFADKIENGKMLEATVFRDWCYGTSLDTLDANEINVGVFNADGIDILLDNPQVSLYVVYVSASAKTRLLRSLHREEEPDVDEIVRRYLADEKDFADFYAENCLVSNETNNSLEESARGIIELANSHWAKETNL